ncbi:energy transducer TonB [Tunturiibacter empetritectus]|uniref:TonB family protein n=1 Tax=Tunturiibacter lichenicola TaxID=2051959 RepID=A0A852VGU8_9BACT|nr:energy transducer TonB [Edaphobacter lichenicola]NYF89664.1 TonB family protein [Edaphobacter lichenicola]
MRTFAQLCLALLFTACIVPGTQASQRSASSPPDAHQTLPAKPSRPNPDSAGNYHAGDGVTAPKLIHSVEPEFSDKARKKKVGGNCLVSFIVRTDGTPTDIHLTRSIADSVPQKDREVALTLDQNCVKAVEQYRFEPASYRGSPVPFELKVEVNFRIY